MEKRKIKYEKVNALLKGKKKERALFLGNGINRVQNAQSWPDLLRNICTNNNLRIQVKDSKPYPLTFEEILFSLPNNFDDNLRHLKEEISQGLINYGPFPLHNRVVNTKWTDILTTNYDYALERVINPNYSGVINPGNSEPKFSLYRFNLATERKIWHIHGELNNGFNGQVRFPELSIMIGFEHYSDYLRKIHQLVKPDDAGFASFLESEKDTWVKRFFTHNIDIVGFGFEYSENHIWYLLNYRARLINQGMRFNNTITYHYPEFETTLLEDRLNLMRAFNVELNPINVNRNAINKYQQFWDDFLSI